ncbi:hypothetical protein PI87_23730 [Ralstonia sp. A12]|nr:hypothetical protein PI87_23730 [Ralstonia sp. A12]
MHRSAQDGAARQRYGPRKQALQQAAVLAGIVPPRVFAWVLSIRLRLNDADIGFRGEQVVMAAVLFQWSLQSSRFSGHSLIYR